MLAAIPKTSAGSVADGPGLSSDLRVAQLVICALPPKVADQGDQGQLVASVRLLTSTAQRKVGCMPKLAGPAGTVQVASESVKHDDFGGW